MKQVKHYTIVILVVSISFSLSFVLSTMDSCSSKATQNESIELGEIITLYKIPYLNDHSIIYNRNEKRWHLYGIVSPHTSFIHLTADSLSQQGWMKEDPFTDGGAEIWAPHIIYYDNLYHMFYTKIGIPREIHHVVSKDLYRWSKSSGPVLALSNEYSDNLKNKDPMVFRDEEKKQWVMYYSMMKDDKHWVIGYCTSNDLDGWSEPQICFDENTESPGVESPYSWNADDLVKRIEPLACG